MASLLAMASCIGLDTSNGLSLVKGFFGYASPPPWLNAPSQTDLPQSLSLLTQMKRLQQIHFHLDCIRVGTDQNGLLSAAQEEELDCAVHIARDVYAQIGVGIGRVVRGFAIPHAEHPELDFMDDDDEAVDMVDDFSAPGGGIDVFFVQGWGGSTIGITPGKPDGVAVLLESNTFFGTGRTLSHELGHFFGLDHQNGTPTNIMAQTSKVQEAGIPEGQSLHIAPSQAAEIRDSDSMSPPC